MADSYQLFNEIREAASREKGTISNVKALGLKADAKALHTLWMYPDVLNVFGSRGDIMALMRVACAMRIPAEIRRIDSLSENIDFEWADIIYYPAGDLSCMDNIMKRNEELEDEFRKFAQSGRTIIAISSSGAILAEELIRLDGSSVRGLGLLGMKMTERKKVHGDDLWIKTSEGMELIGNQIQLADIELTGNQEPFADVIYGRGNNGGHKEGAMRGNVIFTACLGPVMVRNPWFAAEVLKKAATHAGIVNDANELVIPEEEIVQERMSFEEALRFIKDKM